MKPKKVIFVDEDLEKAFYELSNKDPVKKALIRAIRDIHEDSFYGRNVKKKLIPRELIEKYGVDNLWIYNLPSAWRMLYSLTRDEENIKIIAVVLDWMNHKDYEKLFSFN